VREADAFDPHVHGVARPHVAAVRGALRRGQPRDDPLGHRLGSRRGARPHRLDLARLAGARVVEQPAVGEHAPRHRVGVFEQQVQRHRLAGLQAGHEVQPPRRDQPQVAAVVGVDLLEAGGDQQARAE
jgi:hypothetical protein